MRLASEQTGAYTTETLASFPQEAVTILKHYDFTQWDESCRPEWEPFADNLSSYDDLAWMSDEESDEL